MQARTQVYSVKQLRGREASAPQFQTSIYSSKLFKISIFFLKKKIKYLSLIIYLFFKISSPQATSTHAGALVNGLGFGRVEVEPVHLLVGFGSKPSSY
jgi:hypothetical protein